MMDAEHKDGIADSTNSDSNSGVLDNLFEAHECENDDFKDTQWSLANLPDVILVKIMKFLCLKDKYYLSVTCQRFYYLFTHPDLWKVANINMMQKGIGKGTRSHWYFETIMPKTMLEIVKRFSHLFQHLHLQTPSIIKPFEKSVVKMLNDLSHECRLESLSLQVGVLESKDEDIQLARNFYSDTRDVHLVVGLLRKAVRLKHLKIVSWPLREDTSENGLFQTLLSNQKLKSLESLSLFYINMKQQWTGRVPNLPTPEQAVQLFSFLPNLTHISLRSPMINDDVIHTLASEKRKKLKVLEVLVMWSRVSPSHDGTKIPEISDQSWKWLKKVSPHVSVEFVIYIRIPLDELIVMFNPEVPLSSVRILKFGQCGAMLVDSIASKYAESLTSFISLCDSSNCDAALLNLIKECKNLSHIVYHGDINYKTIMQMAEIFKASRREMKLFEFKERNVKTENLYEDEEDDIVIRQDNETQEYLIAGIQAWHYDEELHRKKLDILLDYIKDIFGTSWSLCAD